MGCVSPKYLRGTFCYIVFDNCVPKIDVTRLGPSQYFAYAIIIRYVLKIIYLL